MDSRKSNALSHKSGSLDALENEQEAFQQYADGVRESHYTHWIMLLAVSAYAWQLYGFWIGAAVLIGTLIAIVATNLCIMWLTGSLKLIAASRWGWLLLVIGLVIARSVSFGRVSS